MIPPASGAYLQPYHMYTQTPHPKKLNTVNMSKTMVSKDLVAVSWLVLAFSACGGPASEHSVNARKQETDVSREVSTETVPDRDIFVPNTISEAAQNMLRKAGEARLYKRIYPASDDTAGWRKVRSEMEASALENNRKVAEAMEVTVTDTVVGGVKALDIRPKGWKEDGRMIVFCHGGAYTLNSARTGIVHTAPLARMSGLRILSIDYTTAPNADWKGIQQEVVDVFKALLAKGYRMGNLGIYGASAGGGLATSTVLNLRDQGLGMPAAAVLWSPWVDLTKDGDTQTTLEDQEPMLLYDGMLDRSAKAFAAGLDLKDPRVSPMHADFKKGFPPTLIQEGTKTIFLSTSIRLYQRLDEAGQKPVIDMYEGMVHVFQQLPIPEAEYAVKKTAEFFKRHLK